MRGKSPVGKPRDLSVSINRECQRAVSSGVHNNDKAIRRKICKERKKVWEAGGLSNSVCRV
jgi:hypothetical protein